MGSIVTDSEEASALGHKDESIMIYSNSWGPIDDGSTVAGAGPLLNRVLSLGAAHVRKMKLHLR